MADLSPRSTQAARAAERLDGKLENAMTKMGIPGFDTAEATRRVTIHYTPQHARREYRGSWAAQAEIDRPAKDLIGGYELEGLDEGVSEQKIKAYLDKIGFSSTPEDRGALASLSLLYATANKVGLAIAVAVVADGLPSWEPLDLTRVESLLSLEVLEGDEVSEWRTTAAGPPEFWVIGASRAEGIKPSQLVHHTRVIVAKGRRLGPKVEAEQNGWGCSVLEALDSERTGMHTATTEMTSLVGKVNQDAVFLAELNEMMCETAGELDVDKRLALIARARGQHGLIPLDAGKSGAGDIAGRPSDAMTLGARPVRGVADLGTALSSQWAAGTGQTESIALGRTVGGLNSGENAGDWQSWSTKMLGEGNTWLKPRLTWVIELAMAAKDGPTQGVIAEGWTVEINSLWKPSPAEDAALRASNATTDALYLGLFPELAEPIKRQRFTEGNTGAIHIDPEPEAAPGLDPETGEELPAAEGDPEPEPGDIPTEDAEPEPTETDIAWSDLEPPADASTATDLGDALGVTSNLVHRVAKDYGVTAYKKRGYPGVALYSEQDIKGALVKRQNGEEPELDEPEAVADRKDASRWRKLVGWLGGSR